MNFENPRGLLCPGCQKDWCECSVPEPVVADPTLHSLLVLRAEKWLRDQNCKVVIRDPFRCSNNEQPDAIGWRSGVSILIEVKTSRSDFLADKNKKFRQNPDEGMGDWRIYFCPPEIIQPSDLPGGWGLLWVTDSQVRKMYGIPPNTLWDTPPNQGHKNNETTMLVSALRRLELRGYLPEIYDPLENNHK